MKKVNLNELRNIVKQIIKEENNPLNNYLPQDLKNNKDALKIMDQIVSLLDILNDPDVDQSEDGISDKMRKIALHMLNSNR